MPFGPVHTPSIALGLLASELRGAGIETETFYFTIPFARKIGVSLYELISSGAPETCVLFGDWLFRDALFGLAAPDRDRRYIELLEGTLRSVFEQAVSETGRWSTRADLEADISTVRGSVDGFLDDCVEAIVARKPMLVGFTTVFQQNVASLALASRIKERLPLGAKIVFGGANCESPMGEQLLASFDQIDYVVSGEGESTLLDLARALKTTRASVRRKAIEPRSVTPSVLGGRSTAETDNLRAVLGGTSPIDLDTLAYPDYDSYFEQAAAAPEIARRARLLFESARGCWWGAKHHCTFCGLNGTSMAFRSKSARRAFDELQWLTSRYPAHAVSVVDNILDLKYFNDFIPMLERDPMQVELFYEVKANLRKSQLRQLRRANIRRVQPGIESLHDGVLSIMRKGVSAIQNIQFLKWSLELGIDPLWNLIWGFPGELPDWYSEMATLVPQIQHLPPPDAFSAIRLDRFSPLFDDARLGARDQRPFPAYELVYVELNQEARAKLAYHFTFEYDDERDVAAYTDTTRRAFVRWIESSKHSAFFSIAVGDELLLCDLRDPGSVDLTLLDSVDARLYHACDAARTPEGARSVLAEMAPSLSECEARLRALVASRAMIEIGGRYLSLAIGMNDTVPHVAALQRFQRYLECNNISTESSVTQVRLRTLQVSAA